MLSYFSRSKNSLPRSNMTTAVFLLMAVMLFLWTALVLWNPEDDA